MTAVQLTNLDARLAFLALQYHLARPGSELDPLTKQPGARGLSEAAAQLEPQLERSSATIELSDQQRERLASAMAGAINELKASALLTGGGGQSMVPAFRDTLRRLFPEAAEDPDEATRLAGHLLTLRRKLEHIPPEGGQASNGGTRRSRWRFWDRSGG